MRITVTLGTRPEVIKLAPVVQSLRREGIEVRVVHTGQHTDANLAGNLARECNLSIDEFWALPTESNARLASVFKHSLDEFATNRCDAAVVLGDTWTVPLVGLAARSNAIPVVHIEAGLRSHNQCSQEEINRRTAVAFTRLHLAPTRHAANALRTEGVAADLIEVTGNPVTDALRATGARRVAIEERHGVLFTAHRATNVDDPSRLGELVRIVANLRDTFADITIPLHPRTAKQLRAHNLFESLATCATVIEPLGYRELLDVLRASKLVVTDSGGLQEEAAWFAVPTVVMRSTTPRPEGIDAGFAMLAGVDVANVNEAARALTEPEALRRMTKLPCPYGDGNSAPRITAAIIEAHRSGRLQLREPILEVAA